MILRLRLTTSPAHGRIGPLGRLARLVLLAIFAGSLYSILDSSGSVRFRNPHILTEPSAWLLHGTMLIVYVVLVDTISSAFGGGARIVRRTRIGALAALVGGATCAAIAGQVAFGAVWGFPLADLVWWFDVVMLAVGAFATALAIVLGTPGCEIHVLGQLVARYRGVQPSSADASPCVIGLHVLDKWEGSRGHV